MRESKSESIDIYVGVSEKLAREIVDKQTVVFEIPLEQLEKYQKAGERSNYDVQVIARQSQSYYIGVVENLIPAFQLSENANEFGKELIVRSKISEKPVQPGRVAIAIKRPQEVSDHTPFYNALHNS